MVKSERFEMRMDDEQLARVDEWMKRTGSATSRADELRQLVDIGLGTMTGKSIQLTADDKLNFMLLRDLVKHLKAPTRRHFWDLQHIPLRETRS